MRSIQVINDEIKKVDGMRSSLVQELEEIKKHCPHPEVFITTSAKDIDYDDGCAGSYDYTFVEHRCSLCNGYWASQYDKNIEERLTIEDIKIKERC